jgi:hypothetical protein
LSKTIIFHIGAPKTGSTFLQKTFWESRQTLRDMGVDYLSFAEPGQAMSRYANAGFIYDASMHEAARTRIHESPCDRILISEEGLFGRPSQMLLPFLDDFTKEVILYVRRPANMIVSWTAEHCRPYNAFISSLPGQTGPLEFNLGLLLIENAYAACAGRCFGYFARHAFSKVTVRPYEMKQFAAGNILDDILPIVGIDAQEFRAKANLAHTDRINASATRKHCDISFMVWDYLKRNSRLADYSLDLVNRVSADCKSGDDRPPIETISDDKIESLSSDLLFVEQAMMSLHSRTGDFFLNRFPDVYKRPREPHKIVDPREIEDLVNTLARG